MLHNYYRPFLKLDIIIYPMGVCVKSFFDEPLNIMSVLFGFLAVGANKKIENEKNFYGVIIRVFLRRRRAKLLMLRKKRSEKSNTEVKDEAFF